MCTSSLLVEVGCFIGCASKGFYRAFAGAMSSAHLGKQSPVIG
jgi:hypothetical protein